MRRFVFFFVLLPLAAIIVILSVANRQAATLSFDPFNLAPALSLTAPLFVLLFVAVAVGVLVGSIATWLGQGRWRRLARQERSEADRLRTALDDLSRARALPPPTQATRRDAA